VEFSVTATSLHLRLIRYGKWPAKCASPGCDRMMASPAVRSLLATALVSCTFHCEVTAGDQSQFKKSDALGLVPHHYVMAFAVNYRNEMAV